MGEPTEEGWAEEVLDMIAARLEALGCQHPGLSHQSTPPMFYDDWIACVVGKREAENARLRERAEALEAELAKARTSETITMWRGAATLERAGFTVVGLDAEVKRLEQQADALAGALEENRIKRHEYGMWIAMLEREKHPDIAGSHTNPIEACQSPGCVRNRAALRAYRECDNG